MDPPCTLQHCQIYSMAQTQDSVPVLRSGTADPGVDSGDCPLKQRQYYYCHMYSLLDCVVLHVGNKTFQCLFFPRVTFVMRCYACVEFEWCCAALSWRHTAFSAVKKRPWISDFSLNTLLYRLLEIT